MVRFLENLIGGATSIVKRQKNERQALGWERVAGKITRHMTSASGSLIPLVEYSYTFEARDYSGSCTGHQVRDGNMNSVEAKLEATKVLLVRVNPQEPSQSSILNSDNPRLPFEVDHLTG